MGVPARHAAALGTHAWFFFMAVAGAVVTPFALRTVGLNPFSLGVALGALLADPACKGPNAPRRS